MSVLGNTVFLGLNLFLDLKVRSLQTFESLLFRAFSLLYLFQNASENHICLLVFYTGVNRNEYLTLSGLLMSLVAAHLPFLPHCQSLDLIGQVLL